MFSAFNSSAKPMSSAPSIDPRKREVYMCVPAVRGPLEKSFEEQRMEDYLQSYTKTRQPPRPLPESPKEDHERLALGFPPHFQPHIEVLAASTSNTSSSTLLPSTSAGGNKVAGTFAHIKEPPDIQLFDWARVDAERARYVSISALYTHFSPEELRYHAYLKGNKYPPPSTASMSGSASDTSGLLAPPANEFFQSISCQPDYQRHSFEELRIAYLTSGRQLTSNEIGGTAPGGSSTPASASSVPNSSPFGLTTTPSVFGSTATPTVFGSTATRSVFGSTTAPSSFGSATALPSVFGSTTAQSTFGSTTPVPSALGSNSSLFGPAATPSVFGATTAPSSFGSTAAPGAAPGFGNGFASPSFLLGGSTFGEHPMLKRRKDT